MKLSVIILFNILAFTILNAQTTMCFKENHKSMSTIETVKLDGGLCQGQNSVQDMHKNGWTTDDIKINNSNYIYIFKKSTALVSDIDMDALEQKVVEKLQKAEEEKKKVSKEKLKIGKLTAGKKTYINKCQLCHGPKGMKRAENTSRPIGSFSLDQFIVTMRGYKNGDKDFYRGRAMMMKPYADTTDSNEIKNIYVYLKNINSSKPEKLVEEKK